MPKVLHFPITAGEKTPQQFMAEATKAIAEEGIEHIVIAGRNKEGYWVTGYLNADWGTRNEALGHIQADIIDQMILSNLDRYVE